MEELLPTAAPTVLTRQFNLTELNWRRFGPKLFNWDDRDGITYSLRLLPLCGYVSLPKATAPSPTTTPPVLQHQRSPSQHRPPVPLSCPDGGAV